jgi:hypothetical protein
LEGRVAFPLLFSLCCVFHGFVTNLPSSLYGNKFGRVVKSAIIYHLIPKILIGKILCSWDGTNIFIFKALESNLSLGNLQTIASDKRLFVAHCNVIVIKSTS